MKGDQFAQGGWKLILDARPKHAMGAYETPAARVTRAMVPRKKEIGVLEEGEEEIGEGRWFQ